MRFTFKKADRILKRSEFMTLARHGRKLQNDVFIAVVLPGATDRSRLGITVTRKVGNAVRRNRIKRLVREFFRRQQYQQTGNWDINIIAKKRAAGLRGNSSTQTTWRGILNQTNADRNILGVILRALIWVYKLTLSPVLGANCRFYPSCSDYALEALSRYGPFRGAFMMVKRILRCHPFHPGGVDPVP